MLVGGCGSGRTTLLHQLRERLGRTAAQYIDVERTATTPERFLPRGRGGLAVPGRRDGRAGRRRPRRVRRDARASSRARAPQRASRRRSCSTNFSSCAPSRASPACAACCTSCVDGLAASGNRFVLTSRYVARTLRLLRDRSARFEVIHMPALTAEDTLDMLGADAAHGERRPRRARRRLPRAHRAGARRRPPGLRPRARRRARGDARARRPGRRRRRSARWRRCSRPTAGWPRSAVSATSCGCIAPAATARSRRSSRSSARKKG